MTDKQLEKLEDIGKRARNNLEESIRLRIAMDSTYLTELKVKEMMMIQMGLQALQEHEEWSKVWDLCEISETHAKLDSIILESFEDVGLM